MFGRVRMPSLGGATGWLNSERLGPAELRGRGRARELLDADLHQLAAPGAVGPCVVAGLPRRRAGRDRSAHAGVFVRPRPRPRPTGDAGACDRPPGRARQRLRDLERLRQQYLARRSTSSTRRASSETTTSAKAATSNPSASSSSCSASTVSSATSTGSAWRRRPTGTTCGRPRLISVTSAASTSRPPNAPAFNQRRAYELPERPRFNDWALAGEWTVGRENVVLERAGGSIAHGSTRAARTSWSLPERVTPGRWRDRRRRSRGPDPTPKCTRPSV